MTAQFSPIDFREFHREELPRRLAAGHGALAAEDDLAAIGALAFRLPSGEAFTYRPRAGGVDVLPGDAAADTVIELAPELWSELVHDLESAPGLLYAGRARCAKGDAMRFVRWEPGLRAMYHGRPIFAPARTDLRDRHGRPLDPARGFALGDDRADMAHFLRTAGWTRSRRARAKATSARGGARMRPAKRCCAASRAAARSTPRCARSRATCGSLASLRCRTTTWCRASSGATVSPC